MEVAVGVIECYSDSSPNQYEASSSAGLASSAYRFKYSNERQSRRGCLDEARQLDKPTEASEAEFLLRA
jgi:hypothetical protein